MSTLLLLQRYWWFPLRDPWQIFLRANYCEMLALSYLHRRRPRQTEVLNTKNLHSPAGPVPQFLPAIAVSTLPRRDQTYFRIDYAIFPSPIHTVSPKCGLFPHPRRDCASSNSIRRHLRSLLQNIARPRGYIQIVPSREYGTGCLLYCCTLYIQWDSETFKKYIYGLDTLLSPSSRLRLDIKWIKKTIPVHFFSSLHQTLYKCHGGEMLHHKRW